MDEKREDSFEKFGEIRSYFSNLGYPDESFEIEHKSPAGIADFLILDTDHNPFIVIELKDKVSDSVNIYDIDIRQSHQLSTDLDAPYFVLSDGIKFRWFETGSTGRPINIEPLEFEESVAVKSESLTIEQVKSAFRKLRNYTSHNIDKSEANHFFDKVQFFFVKLYSEREHDGEISEAVIDEIIEKIPELKKSDFKIKDIWRFSDLIRGINLTEIPKRELLAVFEQFQINYLLRQPLKIPKWLAFYMVCLCQPKTGEKVLNLNADSGELLAALSLKQLEGLDFSILGQVDNPSYILWSMIPAYILSGQLPNFVDLVETSDNDTFQKIICVPPFGGKSFTETVTNRSSYFNDIKTRKRDNQLLISAIDTLEVEGTLVFLATENFCYQGGENKLIRKLILKNTKLKAIIGMPRSIFSPYTNIKTNLLIIEKSAPKSKQRILVADMVKELPQKDEFQILGDSELNQILDKYLYPENNSIQQIAGIKFITNNDIEENNYSYTPSLFLNEGAVLPNQFDSISLRKLSETVVRGKKIRLSTPGNSKVLTAAAIRSLFINDNELKLIDENSIPSDAIRLEKNDIVINAIGTYMGEAAIVEDDYIGLPVNQHVIVVKPDEDQINPYYLALALNSDYVKKKFIKAGTIPQLNLTNIRSALIPLPPSGIQEELIKSAEHIRLKLTSSIQETELLRNKLDNLTSSLDIGGIQ